LLGDYAVIFGRYPNNFWHFVCEYLPKLRNVRAGQIVLIPRNLRPDFLSLLLGLLENLSLKYLIIPRGAVKFKSVVFIEPAVFSVRNQVFSIDFESILWLRTKLLEVNKMAPTFVSKNDSEVYFLLRKSPRRVIRDKELVRMAKMNGYFVVDPVKLSIKQQIEIFQRAKAIIGYPGANWANLIFAHQDLIIYNIVSESASSGTLHQLVSGLSNCVFLNVCIDKKDFLLSTEMTYTDLDQSGFSISNERAKGIIEFIDNHLEA
jgi:capsular polysaccharide biosynthesis protein